MFWVSLLFVDFRLFSTLSKDSPRKASSPSCLVFPAILPTYLHCWSFAEWRLIFLGQGSDPFRFTPVGWFPSGSPLKGSLENLSRRSPVVGRRSIRCDGAVLPALHLPGRGLSSHLCGPERNQPTDTPSWNSRDSWKIGIPNSMQSQRCPRKCHFWKQLRWFKLISRHSQGDIKRATAFPLPWLTVSWSSFCVHKFHEHLDAGSAPFVCVAFFSLLLPPFLLWVCLCLSPLCLLWFFHFPYWIKPTSAHPSMSLWQQELGESWSKPRHNWEAKAVKMWGSLV